MCAFIDWLVKYDISKIMLHCIFLVGLAFGIKESTIANNIFTTVNVLVVIFVVIAGSIKGKT